MPEHIKRGYLDDLQHAAEQAKPAPKKKAAAKKKPAAKKES